MPVWPDSGFADNRASRFFSLPSARRRVEMVAFQRGDACGIVAAIFKAFERIHQLLRDRSASQNADNAAHAVQYPKSPKRCAPLSLNENRDRQILNNYCGLRQR
jgi:hypothetical protein